MDPDPLTVPDDDPYDCAGPDDPLRPMRGCALALPIGCLLWVGFFVGLALLLAWFVR